MSDIFMCRECHGTNGGHYDGCSVMARLKADPVNHPSHYKLFPDQEAIDIIKASLTEEEFRGYCKGNALKYRLRAGEKGDTQQDIDKSNWYRDRLRESGATQS